MLNPHAPILPYIGVAGLKLYDNIDNFKTILMQKNVKTFSFDKSLVRYEIDNLLFLFFNLVNGKLYKITALGDYKGSLFNKIFIGTNVVDLLKIEPSFEYDEFEEVYHSKRGVFIETDAETNDVMWISVFVKELETDKFDDAKW